MPVRRSTVQWTVAFWWNFKPVLSTVQCSTLIVIVVVTWGTITGRSRAPAQPELLNWGVWDMAVAEFLRSSVLAATTSGSLCVLYGWPRSRRSSSSFTHHRGVVAGVRLRFPHTLTHTQMALCISYFQVSARRTRSFNGSLCTATRIWLWYDFPLYQHLRAFPPISAHTRAMLDLFWLGSCCLCCCWMELKRRSKLLAWYNWPDPQLRKII